MLPGFYSSCKVQRSEGWRCRHDHIVAATRDDLLVTIKAAKTTCRCYPNFCAERNCLAGEGIAKGRHLNRDAKNFRSFTEVVECAYATPAAANDADFKFIGFCPADSEGTR